MCRFARLRQGAFAPQSRAFAVVQNRVPQVTSCVHLLEKHTPPARISPLWTVFNMYIFLTMFATYNVFLRSSICTFFYDFLTIFARILMNLFLQVNTYVQLLMKETRPALLPSQIGIITPYAKMVPPQPERKSKCERKRQARVGML